MALVSLQLAHQFPCDRVPEMHDGIETSRGEQSAVGREGCAEDLTAVDRERQTFLATGVLPEGNPLREAEEERNGQGPAVRGESDGGDAAAILRQGDAQPAPPRGDL